MTEAGRGFPRADRLLRGSEYQAAARQGRRAVGPCFVVVVAPGTRNDGQSGPRVGLTVSRRVGGAVLRNRVKRRIREWFRSSRGELPEGTDLVVIARKGAGELSGAEVARHLTGLSLKAGGSPA